MNIKKGFILSLALVGSLNLVSCNNSNNSNTTSSSSSSSQYVANKLEQPGELKTIKDVIDYISKSTSSYTVMNTQDDIVDFARVFTPNYVYNEYIADNSFSDGYIYADQGVCKFVYDEKDNVKISEVVKENGNVCKDLYNNSFVNSFYGMDLGDKSNVTSYTLTGKTNIMKFFKICNVPASSYLDLKDYSVTLEFKLKDNKPSIQVDFELSGSIKTKYSLSIYDFGTSKISILENTVSNVPHAYNVPTNLNTVKDLFSKDNYTRFVYSDNGEVDESEYFTTQYYFNDFSDSYIKQYPELASYWRGYIKISETEKQTLYGNTPLIYDDVYMFYILNRSSFQLVTRENPSEEGHAQGGFTTKQTSVAEVMNYPSKLSLFDNFYLFDEKDENTYSTTDATLISEVISNFNVSSPSGVTMAVDSMDIVCDFDSSDTTKNSITFKLNTYNYSTGAKLDPFEFNFSDFGTTSYKVVEDYITSNNLTRY